MDYFQAVQEGRRRVQKSLDLLQEIAGPSYPMLFLKIGKGDWNPVGEEMLYALVPGKGGTAAVVVCDAEGNSKAMTTFVPQADADKDVSALKSRNIPEFVGEVKLPT